ncbi:MAG TPA: hypothetical protein VFC14_02040 [Burkholderiales bacterium]|jgi:hypothetical protein|nr:hypothetical protein [Burkholderiales bacterium]
MVLGLVVLLLAGCAVHPTRDAVVDFVRFETLAVDERVRYEPGGQAYATLVAELLPAAIAQVEAAHYQPFAGPVIVYVCATSNCFDQRVPGAVRFTAAVIHENRVLLAPRLFESEPRRLYPVLVHELSHLHLGQRLGHYTMRVPVWFHEGLASLAAASGGADLVTEDDARRAIAREQYFLPDAAHDETRRKYADQWHLKISMLYRQSMMLLADWRSASEERFRALLVSLQQRVPFDEAVNAAFGTNALELARRFFDGIRCEQFECAAPAAAP